MNTEPTGIVLRKGNQSDEVIRIDQQGFHYNGQFIADAGEAHRLFIAFLSRATTTP